MRGEIDIEKGGIRLYGQPLTLNAYENDNSSSIGCCLSVPFSTRTSNFNVNSANNFIPFINILHVEKATSIMNGEIEITFAYPIDGKMNITENQSLEFQLPYEDAKREYIPKNITLKICDNENENDNEAIDDIIGKIMSLSYPFSKKRPRIYVLINPHSGKGEAVKIYNEQAKPIIIGSHCEVTVQHTEYSGHATDIAENIDIDKYDMILCASGDGIPYEVINGFYKREDKCKAFSKINIVQIPGGSGNAMSLSCLGATSSSLAILRALKGKSSQIDLMAISKESSNEIILSFLSQTYGAIAQADIGTEWIRSIGSIRFDLGVAYEVLNNRKYPFDLAVKMVCRDNSEIIKHFENVKDIEDRELTQEDFKLKYNEEFQNNANINNLPESWEIYDEKISNNANIFYAGKMPYVSGNTNFFPAALPNDGLIDLVVFDSRYKAMQNSKALLSLDKGTHVWEDCVEHFKVSAYRLIPKKNRKCYISVDGEKFPYEAFQVEVLHKVMRTILWEGSVYTGSGYLENCKI